MIFGFLAASLAQLLKKNFCKNTCALNHFLYICPTFIYKIVCMNCNDINTGLSYSGGGARRALLRAQCAAHGGAFPLYIYKPARTRHSAFCILHSAFPQGMVGATPSGATDIPSIAGRGDSADIPFSTDIPSIAGRGAANPTNHTNLKNHSSDKGARFAPFCILHFTFCISTVSVHTHTHTHTQCSSSYALCAILHFAFCILHFTFYILHSRYI